MSLAIADTSSPQLNNNLSKIVSLRDNALWFPKIPEDHLQLNEGNFKSTNPAASGFRPICCLFGDASNPAGLSKVFVTSEVQTSRTLAFDCHYDTGDIKRLGPQCYDTTTTKTIGYIINRTAGEVKDRITFMKNGELRPPEVSNYS